MKRYIILALVLIFALLGSLGFPDGTANANKGGEPSYQITWSTLRISRSISPGYSWDADLTFTSDKDLSGGQLFITPELRPFVAVSPQNFNTIPANTPNVVHINMAVPTNVVPGNTYQGTIHLKTGQRTCPQTVKILLYIAAPLETVTEQSYNANLELNSKAIDDFYELESAYGADQAREMVFIWLRQQNEVVDAGILDNGDIWITYKSGLDCVISTAPPGMNGSSDLAMGNGFPEEVYSSIPTDITPGNRKAIILSPFYSQPLRPNPSDEIQDTLTRLDYNVTSAYDEDVTVNLIKSLCQYGVVDWSTHGGLWLGNKVRLVTGEEATWLSFYSHIWDIASFRIVESTVRYDFENKIDKQYWAILPSFIQHYATQRYPNSLIHTDACYGLANPTMADAFIKSGAYVYLGWSISVYSNIATEVAESLYHYLADGMTVQQACEKIKVGAQMKASFNFYPSNHGDLSFIVSSRSPWPMFRHDPQHTS